MSQIEQRRNVIANLTSNQVAGSNMAIQFGSGADMIPVQECYFAPVVVDSTDEATSYLDDGVTGVLNDVVIYDQMSGVILQEARASNLLQAVRHKLWPARVANDEGVHQYGLEGRSLDSTNLRPNAVGTSVKRKAAAKTAASPRYLINLSDYLPLERDYPVLGSSGLLMEALVESDANAFVASSGTPAIQLNSAPLMIYDNYRESESDRARLRGMKASGSLPENRYWGYTHHKASLGASTTSASIIITPGAKSSVQGILMVARKSANIALKTANTLTEFDYADFHGKTFQATVNGTQIPQTPMSIGQGTDALSIGGEAYRNFKHLAKVLGRGSKYDMSEASLARFDNTDGTPSDYCVWLPLSDSEASWGSGASLSDPNISVDIVTAGDNSACQLDFFVIYDKSLTFDGGLAQVSV